MSCNKKKKRLEIIRLNDNKDPEGKPKPNSWDVDDPWCFLIMAVTSVYYYLGLEPLPALSFPSPILIRHHNVCAGIGIARKSPPSLDQYILNTGHVAGRLRWKVWWLIPELGAFMMKQATFDYSYDKLNVYLGFLVSILVRNNIGYHCSYMPPCWLDPRMLSHLPPLWLSLLLHNHYARGGSLIQGMHRPRCVTWLFMRGLWEHSSEYTSVHKYEVRWGEVRWVYDWIAES